MNHFKLKSAVSALADKAASMDDDQLAEAIANDPKNYEMKDQQTIFEAVRKEYPFQPAPDDNADDNHDDDFDAGPTDNQKAAIREKEQERVRISELKTFYKYAVKPVKGTIVGLDKRKQEILKGYARTGDCLLTTSITQAHADRLNAQTPNSNFYFFTEAELKLEYIDAEKVIV